MNGVIILDKYAKPVSSTFSFNILNIVFNIVYYFSTWITSSSLTYSSSNIISIISSDKLVNISIAPWVIFLSSTLFSLLINYWGLIAISKNCTKICLFPSSIILQMKRWLLFGYFWTPTLNLLHKQTILQQIISIRLTVDTICNFNTLLVLLTAVAPLVHKPVIKQFIYYYTLY